MTFQDFINAVHQRYQNSGARVPFTECFVEELKALRPDLVPVQQKNRRLRVTEGDFIRIRNAW